MKWLVPYLAKSYYALHEKHKLEPFEFNDAVVVLQKGKKMVSKTLNELEDKGYLVTKRDEVDKRCRLYKLLSMEEIVSVYGEPAELTDPIKKLKKTQMPYLLTGNYASHLYTRYASPAKIEISIYEKDLSPWIAYLKSKDLGISIDDNLAEGKQIAHLYTDLAESRLSEKRMQNGLHLESIEQLITLLLKRKDSFSLTDALSLLITQKLNWQRLISLLKDNNLLEETGILMEITNKEAGRQVFSKKHLAQIKKMSSMSKKTYHIKASKKDIFRKEPERPYQEIAKKWNIDLSIPKSIITKVVQDLIRE
ncbi:MAG: MarR family transcriptional regulator [Planctomycetes bacterium]|nr:MarR family transcriptional regulator [Planctomycetota bacterium]